ncbi:hypothetical protein SAMN05444161_4460 [Rhizobiales bacterium GAS191]|nr:hypothetical protein SAMN05519103_03753 [Rhizobiales bacterium GAS113]SED94843.1 hypothetical protein SAMN05444161_4460 [Rhizobiales bacterium GAS191]
MTLSPVGAQRIMLSLKSGMRLSSPPEMLDHRFGIARLGHGRDQVRRVGMHQVAQADETDAKRLRRLALSLVERVLTDLREPKRGNPSR